MIPLPAFWFPNTFLKALCSLFPSSTLHPALQIFFFLIFNFYLCCFILSLKTGCHSYVSLFCPLIKIFPPFFLFFLSCCFCSSPKDKIYFFFLSVFYFLLSLYFSLFLSLPSLTFSLMPNFLFLLFTSSHFP